MSIGRAASAPYPDPTQFDVKSPYYDPKSKREEPRWLLVDVQVLRKIPNTTLDDMVVLIETFIIHDTVRPEPVEGLALW